MKSFCTILASVAILWSSQAQAECKAATLRKGLELSQEAVALRGSIFKTLCDSDAASIVDADDDSLQGRVIVPLPSNGEEMKKFNFYPPEARRREIQGVVTYVVVVEVDGKISKYAKLQSFDSELLDKWSLAFLAKLRLSPGRLDGAPVRMLFTIPVAFKLD